MTPDTIPISEISQRTLNELVAKTGQSPTAILDVAIEDFRRKVFFEAMNASYRELRSDSQAWADELAERCRWDATNMDGVQKEPCSGDSQ